jgi:hypothetical protein
MLRIYRSFFKNKKFFIISMHPKTTTGDTEMNRLFEDVGFSYDSQQDIFYSIMNAWQRNYGFCRLYDEACAPLSMIIDCEPVFFDYNGFHWLIELWKGQYCLNTGGEIGVYYTKAADLDTPGEIRNAFYHCVDDHDLLQMSFSLKKGQRTLFSRHDKHWWLTGFKLGEFSDPSELVMNARITLKDRFMRDAFVDGLKKTGYSDSEITVLNNTVTLVFRQPRSPQPLTRSELTDRLIQIKNKFLCDTFRGLAAGYANTAEALKALKDLDPQLYQSIFTMGKPLELFKIFEPAIKQLSIFS